MRFSGIKINFSLWEQLLSVYYGIIKDISKACQTGTIYSSRVFRKEKKCERGVEGETHDAGRWGKIIS